jgi:hypothetical protein
MNKPVADLTTEELEAEREHWQQYYADCKLIGQGIGTKEGIRKRAVEEELLRRLGVANVVNGGDAQMRAMVKAISEANAAGDHERATRILCFYD